MKLTHYTNKTLTINFFFLLIVIFVSCKKNWLDVKPDLNLTNPKTIADYQAILDNTSQSNGTSDMDFNSSQNALNELGSGDFYVRSDRWDAASYLERNSYIWAQDIFGTEENIGEWSLPYKRIFYSNIILEGIEKILPKNQKEQLEWNQVKGSALFFRAYNHYDVAQQFCKPYDKNTGKSDLGIPLRLQSDFNSVSLRATVEKTYNQIIEDLNQAKTLLPFLTPEPGTDTVLYRVRPNVSAVNAMLARVYLSMAEYDSALLYANKSLQAYGTLMDYNLFSTTSTTPIGRCNKEVLFHNAMNTWILLTSSRLIVDSLLYRSYTTNDLRKDIFFRSVSGNITFKGSYARGSILFGGLAVDEMYFIRAECFARKGQVNEAMKDLNDLLRTRWKRLNGVSTYVDATATTGNEALRMILTERRKELCFRGLRWADLRRLNREVQFAVTLIRVINGQTYTLLPNDNRYVLPIPNEVVLITGIEQNPR